MLRCSSKLASGMYKLKYISLIGSSSNAVLFWLKEEGDCFQTGVAVVTETSNFTRLVFHLLRFSITSGNSQYRLKSVLVIEKRLW